MGQADLQAEAVKIESLLIAALALDDDEGDGVSITAIPCIAQNKARALNLALDCISGRIAP